MFRRCTNDTRTNKTKNNVRYLYSVPDLPLCLGVLKHRASLARGGGHLPAKISFTMSDLIQRNILNIPKFLEHACLTACLGLPGLPPSGLGLII